MPEHSSFSGRSSLPLRERKEAPPLHFLNPYPREINLAGTATIQLGNRFLTCYGAPGTEQVVSDLVTDCGAVAGLDARTEERRGDENGFHIDLAIEELGLSPEGYTLETTTSGARLTGQTEAGLFYCVQTFLQLVGFTGGNIPEVTIRDWPSFGLRGVMLDMGRGVYRKPLIERCIRIMARLKLNFLHLHLYDDEVMGVRFRNLELGKENPEAIPIEDLAEIVRYARRHHITVCPEIESWGHVNSVVYHYPECYGGPGMWGGSSFGIGEATLRLLERMYEEVVPQLEDNCYVHLGLDEAIWTVLPDMKDRKEVTPEWLVGTLHDILMRVGDRHGKNITMCVWADHGGRPIPERIRDKVIVTPWQYWELRHEDIREKAEKYSGAGKPPFIAGGGKSGQAQNGAFGATRLWCEATRDAPNCRGVDITLWSGNSVERYLVSLFAGAGSAWNGAALPAPEERDIHRETLTGETVSHMMSWQTLFRDADEEAIIRDRGPAVFVGYYTSGPRAGEPVAGTAIPVNPTEKEITA